MRSPAHRHYTLADLEWLPLPALARGQFMVAEAKLPDGQAVPAALVLWARVSAEVDARLSAAPRYPIRLHPNEWQSGDVIWIVDAVGEPKAVQQCIEALTKTAFQGKRVKMLSTSEADKFLAGRKRTKATRPLSLRRLPIKRLRNRTMQEAKQTTAGNGSRPA